MLSVSGKSGVGDFFFRFGTIRGIAAQEWREKGEDVMATEILKQQLETLREKLAQPHTNPKDLHDQVQGMVDLLKANHESVPADLREAVEELQAEILEDFYDNLPV